MVRPAASASEAAVASHHATGRGELNVAAGERDSAELNTRARSSGGGSTCGTTCASPCRIGGSSSARSSSLIVESIIVLLLAATALLHQRFAQLDYGLANPRLYRAERLG